MAARSLAPLVLVLLALFGAAIAQTPFIWTLTDGEDKGIGGGFDVVDDIRQPPWVFKFSYDQGKTISVGNTQFLIPDGISGSAVHRYIGFNETRLISTFSDYWTYALKTTSISAAATVGNFTLNAAFSKTKGYINQVTNNGSKSFGFYGATYLTFSLGFRGLQRPPLDPDFQYDVDHLPSSYDPSAYGRFIKAWGTHYFTRALYGCSYNITAAFDNSLTTQKGSSWTTSNLDLTLKYNSFQMNVKQQKEVNKSSIDSNFADNVKVTANARGGDELKFTVGHDQDAWLTSCATLKVPIPQWSDVEPLTYLVADPVKRANLQKAIVDYGTSGRLPSGVKR